MPPTSSAPGANRIDPRDAAWHAMNPRDAATQLKTSLDGLPANDASRRLKEYGPNSMEAGEGVSPLILLIRQVHNPLIYLLAGAAVLSFVVGHPVDAGVIAGVIILNTLLGFFQEWRAEGALAALRKMAALHARVLRDGQPVEVSADQVVPGDVLLVETGDRIAADALLFQSEELQVDESALTGESQPAAKRPGPIDPDTPVADRAAMVWMSTNVTAGRGRALVVATGMRTQIGTIAGEVRSINRDKTPLQKRMHKIGVFMGVGGVVLAGVVFLLGLLRGFQPLDMMLYAVAVAVSAIPEGLPAVISVTLALGVRRMADRHAIVRSLPAVETLGSTTVICSDKTGTITRNQMTVRKLWAGGRTLDVTGEGYQPVGVLSGADGVRITSLPAEFETLLETGVLNNNARLLENEGQWTAEGNPGEASLLAVALKAGLDTAAIRERHARIHEIPFSSDRKYMVTLHSGGEGEARRAFVKGAPDRILKYCSHILWNGGRIELDDTIRSEVEQANEEMASHALRVMAAAYRELPETTDKISPENILENLTLAGLWGIIDPPREESRQAVQDAVGAGIRPVMITGDQAATALAIARQVGIGDGSKAITGADIDKMDRAALARAALGPGVFARVSPSHKLKIMEALKEQGHVVAMTGDGVNDAPALKGADIGITMGRSGTEVAREAADIILTDDNFATIVHAVEEGRVIYSNLRRVIFFLLSTNLGEILILITALVMGMDLPLTAVMLLWINLVTDGACTVPLGVEPKHRDVLKQPPGKPGKSIVDFVMARRMALVTIIMTAGTLGLFAYEKNANGMACARTVAFTTLAAFQWFQAFNARSQFHSVFSIGVLANRWLLSGVGLAVLLQIAAVETALGHKLFGTVSLSLRDWLLILLVSSSVWVLDEILKLAGLHGRPL